MQKRIGLKRAQKEVVTDHAVVRWAERVEGYDIDSIRDELRADGVHASDQAILSRLYNTYGISRGDFSWKILNNDVYAALLAGACKYSRGDVTYLFESGVLKTITGRQTQFRQAEYNRRKNRGKGKKRKKTLKA